MTTVLIDADRKNRRGRNKYTADSFISDTHKKCSWCDEIKTHSEFHKDKKNIYGKGLAYYCKICANEKSKALHNSRKDDIEYKRSKADANYKTKYNLSLIEREQMLKDQDCKCAICQVELKSIGGHTHTDHDHATGKVRALLCTNCNRGLGHFQDNPQIIQNAINYLSKFK